MKRSKPIRIAIFNHKGGIGKTTLALNISAALGLLNKRVLMVDSDPQCNLTAYLIEEEVIDELLDESESSRGRTIWTALRGTTEGSGLLKPIRPLETHVENVSLIPGDVKLSNFEAALGPFWQEANSRGIRGIRGTTALSELVSRCTEKDDFDYVIYDTGPNIGPLNRVILLDCDYFIVPASNDLFSVRALKTLGQTLKAWIRDWKLITAIAPDDAHLMAGRPEFLGYVPIEFRGLGHSSNVVRHYEAKIQSSIRSDILKVLETKKGGLARSASAKRLGTIRDYRQLVTLSQLQGRPIFTVDTSKEENSTLLDEQASRAKKEFLDLARGITRKT